VIDAVVPQRSAQVWLADQYERLRQAILTGGKRTPGRASVERQGLWAWLEIMCVEAPQSRHLTPSRPPISPPVFQAELVDVWVNLVLGQATPVEAK